MKPFYRVQRSAEAPAARSWHGSFWDSFPTLGINHFHEASTAHRPDVRCIVIHSLDTLHLYFEVNDRYVRSTQTSYQSMVCQDSCVEAFIRPRKDKGYLNFEVNCCGVLHCSYITDWARTEAGFQEWTPIPFEVGKLVSIETDLQGPILTEIADPLTWRAVISIPVSLLENYVGELGCLSGQQWDANFYKCGDKTSHPHWAAWSPVRELNFHDPTCFGKLTFE